MRSMTGFGRGQADGAGLSITCELRSVNHRGLDVKARLPRDLSALELFCVGRVRQALERGRIDLHVQLARQGEDGARALLDGAAASALVDELLAFARARPEVQPTLTLGDLLRARDLFATDRSDDLVDAAQAPLQAALDAALKDLDESRKAEGRGLARELALRLDACAGHVARLRELTAGQSSRIADRLNARLAGEDLDVEIDPARIAQEVALLAERADVSEELARLEVHLDHFRSLVRGSDPAGRKLDFLCQELMREANTTGSKCADATTAHVVVELKAEIERLREQVQNVE